MLQQCLENIYEFKIPNTELIVVDDWSTDNTEKIVTKFEKITYIKINNGWPARARNIWSWYATWKYLIFIDADVFITRHWVYSISKIYSKFDYAVVWWKISNVNNSLVSELHHLIEFGSYTSDNFKKLPMVPSANLMILTKIFRKIGWFNEKLQTWEDNDLCQRASQYWSVVYDWDLEVFHDTQWWWSKLCLKQYKFWKNFLKSRELNPNLNYQVPRKKSLIALMIIPLICANILIIMAKPYFRKKRWKFVPSLPLIVILRWYFWKWVLDSL